MELTKLQKRMETIRKEINKPHRCGEGCLCVVLRIKIDILEMFINHAKKEKSYES